MLPWQASTPLKASIHLEQGFLMTFHRALAAAGFAFIASVSASSALAFSQIVAFGDSLTDNGNLQAATNGMFPAAPYFDGRFTDGLVAVEVMANKLGLPLNNRAIAGALTGTGNQFASDNPRVVDMGMMNQVNKYVGELRAQGKSADKDALYMVWGGGNDFLAVVRSGDTSKVGQVIAAGVTNLVTQIDMLYEAGARNIMVPLMPDLASSFYGTSGAVPSALLTNLSQSFNQALQGRLKAVATEKPGLQLIVFDAPQHLAAARQELAAAGADVVNRCWDGDYTGANNKNPVCKDPSKVFLFDKVHPNAVVHEKLGQAMAAAVPKPDASDTCWWCWWKK
jgi:phospholipase/lecithinase/hemolysin